MNGGRDALDQLTRRIEDRIVWRIREAEAEAETQSLVIAGLHTRILAILSEAEADAAKGER